MSLKTAWLNLQDGLGNRFAWSHVNAIYYSQAQNKLLKDKLDDMETAINAKVAKTDIVQVESTSQSTVPSSAYLKSVKDDLDSEINTLSSGKANVIYTGWGKSIYIPYAGSGLVCISDSILILMTTIGGTGNYRTVKSTIFKAASFLDEVVFSTDAITGATTISISNSDAAITYIGR